MTALHNVKRPLISRIDVSFKNFGDLLRSRREATTDPATGRPYTQERLGELLSEPPLAATTISTWERGGTANLKPEYVNKLAELLPVTVTELLLAIGYEVETDPLRDDEREILAAFRRLRSLPILQETALRVVRSMVPPPGHQ